MGSNSCSIIGIDCATERNKRGVSLARFDGTCVIESAKIGLSDDDIGEMLAKRKQEDGRVLLALDAPLGWPEPLGGHLVSHMAGEILSGEAHALFRRETDRFIKNTYNLQSLDVGADRIARTAHSALKLLDFFRRKTDSQIPLADCKDFQGISAIEVYPAATLSSHGFISQGYKNKSQESARIKILDNIEALKVSFSANTRSNAEKSADALDAIVCVLAGVDFIKGESNPPENLILTAKEGWIWVRKTAD